MIEDPPAPAPAPIPAPQKADKAVSTDDLDDGMDSRWVAWEAVLQALVESKASAIKAENEAKRERRRSRAWRLLSRSSESDRGPGHQVTPMMHHPSACSLYQHHHRPLHPYHHHLPHPHQPPITLQGDPETLLRDKSGESSSSSEVTINAGMLQPPPLRPRDLPRTSFSSALTASHLCTTSDAPALPSDETATTLSPDPDPDQDQDCVVVPIGDFPCDPPPLRRTLSSSSHKGYHNFDYSAHRVHPAARRVASWSCSASPVSEKYVSLTVPDDVDDMRLDESEANLQPVGEAPVPVPVLRRPRRKKKRRRRGRAAAARRTRALADKAQTLSVDPDDLPKRARWTIVVTACLLLVMSMLLVGVTLRMAPIIDEMVRKENEEHMNMLNRANMAVLNVSVRRGP